MPDIGSVNREIAVKISEMRERADTILLSKTNARVLSVKTTLHNHCANLLIPPHTFFVQNFHQYQPVKKCDIKYITFRNSFNNLDKWIKSRH